MPNRIPSLPADLAEMAILLDVDGTLLDLAPTPRDVFVSPDLRATLERLWNRTGGAVAFVSGRTVSELDLIFSPLQLPAIGGHGAELRALIDGRREGSAVTFAKVYEDEAFNSDFVRYEGTIAASGDEINGRWDVPGHWSGSFIMVRDSGAGETAERRIAETIETP